MREKITIIVCEIAGTRSNFRSKRLNAADISAADIIMPNIAEDVQKIDTRAGEAEHGITIESTGNSLLQMIIMLNYFSYNRLAF